jgi:hypothetical protein
MKNSGGIIIGADQGKLISESGLKRLQLFPTLNLIDVNQMVNYGLLMKLIIFIVLANQVKCLLINQLSIYWSMQNADKTIDIKKNVRLNRPIKNK